MDLCYVSYAAALHTRDARPQCSGRFSFQMPSHKYTAAIEKHHILRQTHSHMHVALEKFIFLHRRRWRWRKRRRLYSIYQHFLSLSLFWCIHTKICICWYAMRLLPFEKKCHNKYWKMRSFCTIIFYVFFLCKKKK